MGSIHPDYFIHTANVLLLVAYSVRDVLWLRLFAMASAVVAMPYFLLQPRPLWAALIWSAGFFTINLFQSWRLFVERRPVKLAPDEEEVSRLIFQDLPPRKVLQVLSLGSWTNVQPGELLLESGNRPDAILLIVRGTAWASRNGRRLGRLCAGSLVGSALLMTGVPADLDVVAVEPLRALRWEMGTLDKYLSANPEIRIMMQRFLARDLASKFVSQAAPSAYDRETAGSSTIR